MLSSSANTILSETIWAISSHMLVWTNSITVQSLFCRTLINLSLSLIFFQQIRYVFKAFSQNLTKTISWESGLGKLLRFRFQFRPMVCYQVLRTSQWDYKIYNFAHASLNKFNHCPISLLTEPQWNEAVATNNSLRFRLKETTSISIQF